VHERINNLLLLAVFIAGLLPNLVSCQTCREGPGGLPRKSQAELSSTRLKPGSNVYLSLVPGEMPLGVAFALVVC